MQKVYVLLRNNQQTGPFSLEEVVQFELKPYDLIWIEGASAGWYYPQEIKALHPYLSFVEQQVADTKPQPLPTASFEKAAPKKIFVSMPVSQVQEEAAKKPSASLSAATAESFDYSLPNNLRKEPELKTTYAKSLEEVETEFMNWTYQKKTKRKSTVSKKGAIAACLLVTIAFAGWWAIKSFSVSTNNKSEQVALAPDQNQLPADSVAETDTIQTVIPSSIKKTKPLNAEAIKKEILLKKEAPKEGRSKVVLNNNPTANNEYEETLPRKEETKVAVERKDPEPIAEAPKEQKKKLGEKILDLFKKKPEEKKNEEAKPAENENGERRAARRETNLATQVTIKFEVPNDWMMGIKGAKASLTNRSSETIVKATIEVQYYSEDNELLQTKTLNFSNIGAKKTATLPIPDHSLADHLDYKIISAQGAAEPFAKM